MIIKNTGKPLLFKLIGSEACSDYQKNNTEMMVWGGENEINNLDWPKITGRGKLIIFWCASPKDRIPIRSPV